MDSSREQRAEDVAEAFTSLRLDRRYPTPDVLRDADDYIEGRKTLDEILEDVIERYRPQSTPHEHQARTKPPHTHS